MDTEHFKQGETAMSEERKKAQESEVWESLGDILSMTDVKELELHIEDKSEPAQFRCAALDRYVEISQAGAEALLTKIVVDQEDHEDVRVVAYQWLRDPKVKPQTQGATRTRGAVKVRGAAQRRGGQEVAEEDWRMKAANDPSARVRWLAALDD